MSIYEGEEYIYLKVNDAKYDWQFVVDLTDGNVLVNADLLAYWGWDTNEIHIVPDINHFMAEKEIQRGIDNGHHPTQRLGNLIEVQSVSSDNLYWEFEYDGIVHEVKTPGCFTKVLDDVLATRKALISNNLTVEEVRDRLTELGYISPYTSAIAPYQVSAPVDPHAIVSSWEVNGELIR